MRHYDNENNCEYLTPNSLDIQVKSDDCEIRADLILEKPGEMVRLWGQIKDHFGKPIANTLVKLLKVESVYGKVEYKGVAHTISDCDGFYQFDIKPEDQDSKYKILVGKAASGKERVLASKGNCYPTDDDSTCPCNPCNPYDPMNPCNQGYKCKRLYKK